VPICEECGSHDVERKQLYGLWLEECGLCDHLQGDPREVARVELRREADALGISTGLFGLIRVLDSVPGIVVDRHLTTVSGALMPPTLFFTIRSQALEILDRLTRSLLLSRSQTSTLWTVEASHQGRLLFVLRPRLFHSAAELSRNEEEGLERDLDTLHRTLARDVLLPWWELPVPEA